ncbi:MAG: S8 family serine peptidase, partial [Ilumatobacter sp.]
MATLSALPGRDWQLASEPLRAGRELLRSATSLAQRPPVAPPSAPATTDGARGPRGTKRVAAVLALAGLGLAAYAVDSGDSTPVIGPTTDEAFVDAADLPAGSMFHVVDQIGARDMWAAGFTGAGVNVAVVDTGVAGVDGLDGEGKIVAAVDLTSEAADPTTRYLDSNGHGTFIAGIIAGNESGTPAADAVDTPQEFKGVAPDAGIVSVKVAGRDGSTSSNDVTAGIDWVVDNAVELDIGVLNFAFDSGSTLPYQEDALTAALERAWNAGIVVVVPAGNDGADAGRLASPAIDPHFIAVGGVRALDDGFEIAEWSNSGDGVRNPDIVAPGAHIQSLRVPGSDADVNHPEGFVDGETFLGSGTSEATAVVAAAAALLRDAHPDWTNDQIKSALTTTSTPLAGVPSALQGHGLFDVVRASGATTLSEPNTWPAANGVDAPMTALRADGFVGIWSGTQWSGTQWSGTQWSGNRWSGTQWSGTQWSGNRWSGTQWSGTQWSGNRWSGTQWSGTQWSGNRWSGTQWSGTQWSGTQWSGTQWSGTQWSGTQWSGTQWSGTQWSGTQWSGTQWSGNRW